VCFIAMILMLATYLSLPRNSFSQEGISRLLEAEAVVPIINNDMEKAREMAVFEAKRNVFEPLGAQID